MNIFQTNQFKNLFRMMVLAVFLLFMMVPRSAQSEDTVLFTFDDGQLHDFAGGNVFNDSSNTYAGNGALKVVANDPLGDAYFAEAIRYAPLEVPPGSNINVYVYQPAGMSAGVMIYINDANNGFSAVFIDGTSLAPDTWTKVSLEVPEDAVMPLIFLSVQLYAPAQGATLWVDSIGFEGQATSSDSDGDGVSDSQDNCPVDPNPGQIDGDQDGVGDVCDTDNDNDGILDDEDNCPLAANPNQEDTDGDGKGDVCDEDIDDDGVPNEQDNCVLDFNDDQKDFDGDKIGDVCDEDSDQDGVIDANDACLETAAGATVGDNGCSIDQTCPLENNWGSAHAYVRCVAYASTKFLAKGLITKRERNSAVFAALRKVKTEKKFHKKSFKKRESFRFHKREKYKRHSHDGQKAKKGKSFNFDHSFWGHTSRFFRR